jgi:hypothetical protein
VPAGELGKPFPPDPVRRPLGAEVGKPLLGESHPRRDLAAGVGGITRPSSSSAVEEDGIPPGVGPPTSAWWARQAANPMRTPATKTGETIVMSGRWVPPRNGSLRIQDSPGRWSSSRTAATASGIDPRWTGMCSACITSSPPASKIAVEQSCRSLMLAE